jgi:hypothetical protein
LFYLTLLSSSFSQFEDGFQDLAEDFNICQESCAGFTSSRSDTIFKNQSAATHLPELILSFFTSETANAETEELAEKEKAYHLAHRADIMARYRQDERDDMPFGAQHY